MRWASVAPPEAGEWRAPCAPGALGFAAMPRLPIPANPLDIVNALRVLPAIARNTEQMAKSTEVLGKVADDLGALHELRSEMGRVATATEEIGKIDARMANIEAAMPVLVEVQ